MLPFPPPSRRYLLRRRASGLDFFAGPAPPGRGGPPSPLPLASSPDGEPDGEGGAHWPLHCWCLFQSIRNPADLCCYSERLHSKATCIFLLLLPGSIFFKVNAGQRGLSPGDFSPRHPRANLISCQREDAGPLCGTDCSSQREAPTQTPGHRPL